jgi:hypothetical protein
MWDRPVIEDHVRHENEYGLPARPTDSGHSFELHLPAGLGKVAEVRGQPALAGPARPALPCPVAWGALIDRQAVEGH